MPPALFHIHCRTEVFESPLSPTAFGTDNWGKVNRFHQLSPDAPIGEGTRFEDGMVYEAFHAVFVQGQPWESTRWFKYNLGLIRKGRVLWECRNAEELLARLNREVRALYASMAQHGFLRQEEISARAGREPEVFARFAGEDYHSSLSPTHEIKLGVNENGRLLFLDGRHRLAIAKLLGIARIPVRVVFVHPDYVRRHRPEAAGDAAAMTAMLGDLFERLSAAHDRPASYITWEDYQAIIRRVPDGPAKNAQARWEYYKSAIDFVRLCKPASGSDVLEIGARGVPIVKGSDTLEPTGRWAIDGAGEGTGERGGQVFHQDPQQLPWPVADKRYEVVVALRVFQHLWPKQRECFWEARRVGRNLVMVVPEQYEAPAAGGASTGVSEQQLTEWNGGVPPSVAVRLPGWVGKIYFWNHEALGPAR